jgi:MFS transporter, SP family, general alpha glucoside:H+ symporter
MCFAIGQFIAAGVIQSMVHRSDEWSYRIPFAIQWIWPAPLIFIAWFMPESPWWLSRNGRYDEAEATLARLAPKVDREAAKRKVAMMIHTNNTEMELVAGSSYLDCYRGTNLRRTEIACVTFAGQVLSGSAFAYSATYFFEQAGMSSEDAYKLGLGGTAIAFCGTVISWFLMSRFGRRNLYLAGMGNMTILLFIIGILTIPSHSSHPGLGWAQSVLCILWLLTFSLTVGPIGWTVPAEVSSTRLRAKTIVLARNAYYLANLVANIVEPYFMNPTELNWKGYTGVSSEDGQRRFRIVLIWRLGFFWCGTASITLIWAFFRLTETKGRTFQELDVMFGAHVPTRQFAKHKVDAYAEHTDISRWAKPTDTDAQSQEKA